MSAFFVEDLLERIQILIELAQGMSIGEMVDLAAKLAQENEDSLPIRAADRKSVV